MLASSFLSAEALGITEPERALLVEFQRRAAAGEIPDETFNMRQVGAPECGTAGCILGWCRVIDLEAERKLERRWTRDDDIESPLNRLFHPRADHCTPAAAAEAVWRYLTTGRV